MQIVVGAGSVGRAVAAQLIAAGQEVVVVTRSGTLVEGARSVKADASDAAALVAIGNAEVIYNCANPAYDKWARDWPPIAAALLTYAESTGAVLATCSNLYGYGPVDGPISPDLPLAATGTKGRVRAQMWEEAKQWHDAGRIRATEVRGSDYIAPSEETRLGSTRVVPNILAGKSISLIGDLDFPHTWTYPADVARTLITCATDDRGLGRAWHVPSNDPRSQRQVAADLAAAAGVPEVKVKQVPDAAIWALGLFNPVMREFRETAYQFRGPYILDDSATRETFGLEPTAWNEIVDEVVAAYRPASVAPARQDGVHDQETGAP